jgi:uncharacterized protein (DUF58 family)
VLDPELARRIASLRFSARRAVEGLRSGIHRSPHRGASVIFAEHRDYRPGDDLRLLDWRAYARSDRHIIKRFEQETHLRAQLWLDCSASMDYGDGPEGDAALHKHAYAATLLAAMAFILLGQGDAVGAVRFGSSRGESLPPRARPGQLEAVIELLAQKPEAKTITDLRAALSECAERAGRRGLIVLASDLLDLRPTALEPLSLLRAAGHDVLVFHVLHPHEIDLPFDDRMRFIDPEGDGMLDTDPSAIRQAYREQINTFMVDCRRRCMAAGARYALARTDKPIQQTVAEMLTGKASQAQASQSKRPWA